MATAIKKNKNSDEEVWNQDQQNNFILNTYQHLLPNELRTNCHELMVIYGQEDYEYVQEFVKDLQNELKDPRITVVLYDDKQYKCFFHSDSENNNEGEPNRDESMEVENAEDKSEEPRDDAADIEETEMAISTISDSVHGEKDCASGSVLGTELIGANCDREKLCHHASIILVFLTKNISNQSFDKDMKDFLVLLSKAETNVVPVYTTSYIANKENPNVSESVQTNRFFLDDITGIRYSSGMFDYFASFKRLVETRFPVNVHKKDIRRGQKISWLKYKINDKRKLGQFSDLLAATQKELHKLEDDLDFEDENKCVSILKRDDLQQQEKQEETEKSQVGTEPTIETNNNSATDNAEKTLGIPAEHTRVEPGKEEESNDKNEELTYKNDFNVTEQQQNQSQSGGADGNDDDDDKIRASQFPPPPPYCGCVCKHNNKLTQTPKKGGPDNDDSLN